MTPFSGKTLMITGGTGSFGEAVLKRFLDTDIAEIRIFSRDEKKQDDLRKQFTDRRIKFIIGDIRDRDAVDRAMKGVDYVFHAAALKHVSTGENWPYETVKTNVIGSNNVIESAILHEVVKVVVLSTDKAVNPTNVMGATKRLAEMIIEALNAQTETEFTAVRFGNVLGSNGSVIPRFKKQIEAGGPITVTHPEITRFFMTIPEACQLVLQAGALGNGGEIFVFDMGKSVKIVDLARKMIKLSGYEVGKDIHIVFTGLRPGEKLYEEVLNVKETTLPTVHERIKIAKVREYNYSEVTDAIKALDIALQTKDNFAVVKQMKCIVPEFKSKNSTYESIDFQMEEEGVEHHMEEVLNKIQVAENLEVRE